VHRGIAQLLCEIDRPNGDARTMSAQSASSSASSGSPPARPRFAGAPRLPLIRLMLALSMVPGMYLIIAVFQLLMVALVVACGFGFYFLVQSAQAIGPTHVVHYYGIKAFIAAAVILTMLTLGALSGLWILTKALFASFRHQTHLITGWLVEPFEEKPLWSFLDGLCRQVGCRVPDSIVMLPTPDFFVTKGPLLVLNGKAKGRVLALGLPLMRTLQQGEFKAIMAHEMAHYTGRDNLFQRLALPVYKGTGDALANIAEAIRREYSDGKPNMWKLMPLKPLFYSLRLYYILFHLINSSISRAREFRADYIAALVAGRQNCIRALVRTTAVAPFFYVDLPRLLFAAGGHAPHPSNMYEAMNHFMGISRDLLTQYGKAGLQEAESPHDDHPSLQRRIDALPQGHEVEPEPRLARELIVKADRYEKQLTDILLPQMEKQALAQRAATSRRF
jgi:Zn-dependent protease with chaperone function